MELKELSELVSLIISFLTIICWCLLLSPTSKVKPKRINPFETSFFPPDFKDLTEIPFWSWRPIQTNAITFVVADYHVSQNRLLRAEVLDALNQMSPSDFRSYLLKKLDFSERESILIDERQRERTFLEDWPCHNIISGTEMARAGFFYLGLGDLVQCIFCHGKCSGWADGQNPLSRHQQEYPYCKFAQGHSCNNRRTSSFQDNDLNNFESNDPAWLNLRSVDVTAALRQLGVNPVSPELPNFATEASRIGSFNNWPRGDRVSAQSLADAGFYYRKHEDLVQCYYCAGGLRGWSHGDDPWEEHARWFPDCQFLLLSKGKKYVTEVHNRTSANKKFRMSDHQAMQDICFELGHARETMARAITLNGGPFEDITEMVDVLHELEGENLQDPNHEQHRVALEQVIGENPLAAVRPSNVTPVNVEPQEPGPGFCKICQKEEACRIALPCGHLVYCERCAEKHYLGPSRNGDSVKCPVCAQRLAGIFRCYII